jgi:hypothetical protein
VLSSYVVLKLPRMDCEELVITLTGVDVCGRDVEYSQTYIVDNIAPDISSTCGDRQMLHADRYRLGSN